MGVGSAIEGCELCGDVKDVLLLDVTPLSLGIETEGGIMTKLVERNATIPTEKSETFSTAADNQSAVTVRVFQGEREIAQHNRLLAEFNLDGIPPAPRGVPQIEVSFNIDANGILQVKAKDKGTGKEQQVKIEQSGGLSESEIEQMKKDAEAHAEEDKKQRALAEAKNKASSLVYATEKLTKEHADKIDDASKSAIEKAIEKVNEASKGSDTAAINQAIEELSQASHALSQHLYSQGGGEQDGPDAASQRASGSAEQAGGGEEVIDAEFEKKD